MGLVYHPLPSYRALRAATDAVAGGSGCGQAAWSRGVRTLHGYGAWARRAGTLIVHVHRLDRVLKVPGPL